MTGADQQVGVVLEEERPLAAVLSRCGSLRLNQVLLHVHLVVDHVGEFVALLLYKIPVIEIQEEQERQ